MGAVNVRMARGNLNELALGASTLVGPRTHRHVILFKGTGDYGEFDSTAVAEKAFVHFRHNLGFTHWAWGEAFAQVDRDAFVAVRLREVAGMGPRFGFGRERHGAFFGTARMLEDT